MIHQENKEGRWIALAVSLPLAAFTIWRAWDLMTTILPASQSIAAVFGIAALDGGMIAWVYGWMKAKSSDQRRVAGIGAFLDFLGVGAATFIDLFLLAWLRGLVNAPTNLYLAGIILISVAVVLNIGIGWLYVIGDPKKKQEIRDQKAHDKINDLADAQIEQHAEMYAPQFAEVKVQMWLRQAQMIHGVGQLPGLPSVVNSTAQVLPQPPTPVAEPQKGLIGRAIDKIIGNSVQPEPVAGSHTESLEQLYKENPALFDQVAQLIKAAAQQQAAASSPLAMPPLTQANPASGNGTNGHQ